jgi:hypothetical protein
VKLLEGIEFSFEVSRSLAQLPQTYPEIDLKCLFFINLPFNLAFICRQRGKFKIFTEESTN